MGLLTACSSYTFTPDTALTVTAGADTTVTIEAGAPADLLLISDTHASNPLAPHGLASDGAFADQYLTTVAVRPPHVDQWGSRILDWILDQPRAATVVVHLGDAANLGCLGELARFTSIMSGARADGRVRRWLMAPGNHDSLRVGNFAEVADPPAIESNWNGECKGIEPAGGMDKHGFLESYLAAQDWQEAPPEPAIDDYVCNDVLTHDPTVQARICRRDALHQYDTFLLQAIELSADVTLILLDTTQYRERPALLHPGGSQGGIGASQLALLRDWLTARPGKRFILAGHYPISRLDDASTQELEPIVHDFAVIAYLSGHLHNASAALLHETTTADDQRFLELNLGSVVDWPMEYGYLSARSLEGTVASTELTLTVATAQQLAAPCALRWGDTRVPSGTAGDYVSYAGGGSDDYGALRDDMFQRLRVALRRAGGAVPDSYPARELTRGEMPATLLGDTPDAEGIADYERCQALWASEAESHTKLAPLRAEANALVDLLHSTTPVSAPPLRPDDRLEVSHRWLIGPVLDANPQ